MATTNATTNIYDHISELIGDGSVDFDNDSFEVLLTTNAHTPNDTDTVIGDIDNEVVGNGYARQTLVNVTWTRAGNVTTLDFDNPVFNAVGGDIVCRNWHLFDTTAGVLVAYGLLDDTPADVTTTDGNGLTLTVSGLVRQTV